jgi:hypothetical protein
VKHKFSWPILTLDVHITLPMNVLFFLEMTLDT